MNETHHIRLNNRDVNVYAYHTHTHTHTVLISTSIAKFQSLMLKKNQKLYSINNDSGKQCRHRQRWRRQRLITLLSFTFWQNRSCSLKQQQQQQQL